MKRKLGKRCVSLLLVWAMLIGSLAGCGNKATNGEAEVQEEIVEETDFSKKSEPVIEDTAKEIRWNPNTSAFPADAPRGTVIICESTPCGNDQTFAQNWEGVAP